ncbi:MAG TPA: hypothetical protein VM029_18260 [Opitutaceae bacterium]|nr:hypothetical protein [Opitutaceae bacterium]
MRLSPSLRWLVAFVCTLASRSSAADPSAIIELPQYVVTDRRELPPAEPWRYSRLGSIEVISSVSKRTTEHLLRDFQQFRQALDLVWPDAQRSANRLDTLIVCDQPARFRVFAPDDLAAAGKVTLVLRSPDRAMLVFDLGTKVIAPGLVPDAGGYDTSEPVVSGRLGDSYRQLYRAYLRLIVSSARPRPPAWYEEGVAQLLMAMRTTSRDVVVGQLDRSDEIFEVDGRPAPLQDLDFNAVLSRSRVIPFGEFLAVDHDAPEANNATGSVWAKQAYAFVHWGLYGDLGKHQKAFVTFIARLAREPLSEDLFKRTFGQSYREMTLTLVVYARSTNYRIAGVEAEKGTKLPSVGPVEVRDATEAEASRIRGEALFLAGKPALAHETMSLPFRRGDRDPDLVAALGLLQVDRGETATARSLLELAASARTTRTRALIELAKLRLAEARAKPAAAPDRFNPAQVAAVLQPLFAARQQSGRTPELYETIAAAWENSAATPEPGHLAVLDEAATLFPRNTDLIHRIAALKLGIGQTGDAAALIDLGLRHAVDAEARTRLVALKSQLPPP